jgi:hypothetical protein
MGNQLTPRPDPIQVYLDSSDIDNLTDARKLAKDARLGETAEVLKEFAAKGIAEFRFSFFHVIELAHADDVSKPFALKRVELVKALCGPKAFLNADELWRLEALSLARITGRSWLRAREPASLSRTPAGCHEELSMSPISLSTV